MTLAPITLFVYNRPYHTKQTIQALQKNELAKDSELFIYSDAPKDESAKEQVKKVREYIKSIDGFKKVTIIERDRNWGLADSIIDGVTKIVNEYGKIIVLEDDLVTSPYFLKFMNEALEFYEDENRVWHISGWNYPINTKGLENDVFLWRVMNCWGWGTWKNRWKFFEKDTDELLASFTKEDIKRFNLDGVENFWGQVLANRDKKINTWAIYWYATIFKQNGLCLNPTQTFVENIGHDGSGIHCGIEDSYRSVLNIKDSIKFSTNIKESFVAVEKIKDFYKNKKKSLFVRAINKISRKIIGQNIIK
jgi:hypothetical protein